MAKIPTYQSQVNLARLRMPQATPESFGAAQARTLGQLGQTVFKTGQQLLAYEQAQKVKEDKNAAREALNRFKDEANAKRAEYQQRRGTDAAGADDDFRADLQRMQKEISGALKTPQQRELFDITAASTIPDYVDQIRRHRIAEAERAKQTTRAAEDTLSVDAVKADPFSTETFLESTNNRMLNLTAALREQGITDPDAVAAAELAEKSRYSRIRVASLLQEVTPEDARGLVAAEQHMQRFGDQMDAASREALTEKIRLVRMAVDAQSVVDMLMAKPDLTDSERLGLVDQGGKGGEFTLAGVKMTREVRDIARQELIRAIQQREQVKKLHDEEQINLVNNELNTKITERSFPGYGDLAAAIAKADISQEKEAELVKNWRAAIGRAQKGQAEAFRKAQYARLRTMADVNPAGFKKVDLYPIQPLLSMADWEKLVNLQNKIVNGETDSPQDRTMRDVRKALRSAIRQVYPVRTGADVSQEEVVAAAMLQNEKLYDMESFIEQRFKQDADRLSKMTDPEERQKYVNNVLFDAYRKFDLDDGWLGFGDTEVFNFEKARKVRELGGEVGNIVETDESKEALEKRTGIPADAPRHPNGNIVVKDREDIENVLRRAGESLPFKRDDGGELREIIVRTGNQGEVVEIIPAYTYPDVPRAEVLGEQRTQAQAFADALSVRKAQTTVSALAQSDPFIAQILGDYYTVQSGKAEE